MSPDDTSPPLPADCSDRIGPYVIERGIGDDGIIGRGGMGLVLAARAPATGAAVAIKLARVAGRSDLRREARAIANLSSPHIVRLLDVGRLTTPGWGAPAGAAWLAMEYIAGQDTASAPPQSVPEAAAMLRNVLAALSHAHARGVLHLDVSPRNILRRADGSAVLADFGVGLLRADGNNPLGGTPGFMAPELQSGQRTGLGPWTDLYAVGRVAERWLPLGRYGSWLARLLADAPAQRFPSAPDALDALPEDASTSPDLAAAPQDGDTLATVSVWVAQAAEPVALPSIGITERPARRLPPIRPDTVRPALERRSLARAAVGDPPLVGRDEVLNTIWSMLDCWQAPPGDRWPARMIGITGLEGSGRHRVASAAAAQVADVLGAPILDIDDAPPDEQLRRWLHGAPPTRANLVARLTTLGAGHSQHGAWAVAGALAGERGLPPSDVLNLWWRTIADTGPLILVAHELNRAPAAARAIAALPEHSPWPLLVIGTGERPIAGAADVALRALGPDDMRRLVHLTLDASDALAQQVLDRADGLPGLAVRLVRQWADTGSLEVGRSGYVLRDAAPTTSATTPTERLADAERRLADNAPEHALLLAEALRAEFPGLTGPASALEAIAHHTLGETDAAGTAAERALAHLPTGDARRVDVLELQTLLALSRGDRAAARERLDRFVDAAPASDDARARVALLSGRLHTILGDGQAAVAAIETALDHFAPGQPRWERALGYYSHALAAVPDRAALEILGERVQREPVSDRVRLMVLQALSDARRLAGDLRGALALSEASLAFALPRSPVTAYTLGNLAFYHAQLGDFGRCEAHAVEGLAQLSDGTPNRARCFLTATRLPAFVSRRRWGDLNEALDLIGTVTDRGITLDEVLESLVHAAHLLEAQADAPTGLRRRIDALVTATRALLEPTHEA